MRGVSSPEKKKTNKQTAKTIGSGNAASRQLLLV